MNYTCKNPSRRLVKQYTTPHEAVHYSVFTLYPTYALPLNSSVEWSTTKFFPMADYYILIFGLITTLKI